MRFLLLCLIAGTAAAADPLPAYNADIGNITVSGVSSGGYMAVQFHVAHSSEVKGVGVLAGGPYYCAQGFLWTAYYNCMTPNAWMPLPSVELLKNYADDFAREGRIDPTTNIAQARVWLFSGKQDRTVKPMVVDALSRFYGLYGVPLSNLLAVGDKPAGHAMVTENAGNACETTKAPYINDCDYDAAGALLTQVLGKVALPAEKESGRLVVFDQRAFAGGDASAISMADMGYAYVPLACEEERCRVHIAFHGCRQSAKEIGERFVRQAGYNRWADANRLIVLYPQTIARYWPLWNPRGCWDWWGYTNEDYATKAGPQIRAVHAMLVRLGEARR